MEERPVLRQLISASMVGIHLVASTFVGLAIGFLLDKYLGTKPWLTILFFILGVATGFRDLFRMINRESSEDETSVNSSAPPDQSGPADSSGQSGLSGKNRPDDGNWGG